MLRRWHVLLLILVTLIAFCGLAAAKLRATPKYDRIQIGMTEAEAADIFTPGNPRFGPSYVGGASLECDEGRVSVSFELHVGTHDAGESTYLKTISDKRLSKEAPWNVSPGWQAGDDDL